MHSKTWLSMLAIALALGAVCLTTRPPLLAWQEEDQEQREEGVEEGVEEDDAEQLERRLDEIEELLAKAEQDDDDERIRDLRREGERILDQLERIERSREEGEFDEEAEHENRELEMHRLHLELERLRAEIDAITQESVSRLADLAGNETTSAVYAIQQAATRLEEEHAREFLTEMLEEVESETLKRVIRHRLADLSLNMGDPERALDQLRSLILTK